MMKLTVTKSKQGATTMKSNSKLIMSLCGIQGNPEKPQQKGNGILGMKALFPSSCQSCQQQQPIADIQHWHW
jgi:hypothetical protein